MPERDNEGLAREIVSSALNVRVDRFEDGSAPSQVDAVIRYPDRLAWLEVIADHDSVFMSQWAQLEKLEYRLEVPGLHLRWVAQLSRNVRVRRVGSQLPAILLRLQEGPYPDQLFTTSELTALGVIGVYSLVDDDRPSGVVMLHAEGWSGSHGFEDMLGEWVVDVLTVQNDVPRKLAACPDGERHAFIWATIGSDYATQFKLENRADEPLPQQAPALPEGVTHVWVAGSMSSQGALAWFPDRGWWRAWSRPAAG